MSGRGTGRGGEPGEAGPVDAATRHGDGEAPRPGEEELFAALDRTRDDLAAAPRPGPPDGFAGALAAALAAERDAVVLDAGATHAWNTDAGADGSTASPVGSPVGSPARSTRRRRALAAGLLVAATAAVVVGVLGTSTGGPSPSPVPTAAPDPGRPVVLTSGDLPRAWRAGLGARDDGPLADPAARTGCLVAHGLPASTVPLGTRAVVLDGRPGTLYVLATGRTAEFRLLVVGAACAPGSPETLQDVTVGG